jgi:hypothetical protein
MSGALTRHHENDPFVPRTSLSAPGLYCADRDVRGTCIL